MNKHNFEVIAEFKDDLNEEEKRIAEAKLKKEMEKWNIIKINHNTYIKKGNILDVDDDFGDVTFFYCCLEELQKESKCFKKLEYHDFWMGENEIAI